jgi:hypothetical protein
MYKCSIIEAKKTNLNFIEIPNILLFYVSVEIEITY